MSSTTQPAFVICREEDALQDDSRHLFPSAPLQERGHGDYAESSSRDLPDSTGRLMSAMATQVEVSSALPSLSNIGELRNEATLQHAFVSSLSDASGKTGDHPGPLPPLILEERNKFGNTLRPSTMPPAASRPRLTPRPFSREKSSETFAVVKPPVPTLKPGPNPSALAKTSEDTTAAKVLTGNVPPLLDQKLMENKSPGDLVANVPFYPSPQNTVILFETGNSEKAKVRVTPEKTFGISHVQQEQVSFSKPETSYRKPEGAGVHRQLSLSTESRPGSWTPRKSLEIKDTILGAGDIEKEQSWTNEVPLRPKPRPVSAIFLESLKDQKQSSSDVSDEAKPVPEKPWVRKPRPLSMDLTAKFENLSVQRKSCVPESKETTGFSAGDSSKSNPKSTDPVADCVKSKAAAQIQNDASPSCRKDVSQVATRDRKYPWEARLKSQEEENERETDVAQTLEKSKGPFPKERTVLNQKESHFGSERSTGAPEVENKTSKGVKKPADFPDSLANGSSPANADSVPESSGKETRVMNIQQRIKELTADSADAKPGVHTRSFRSRPLSSDLTKLFSGPLTATETKPERPTEVTRKPVLDAQGIQEKERISQAEAEANGAKFPWKSPQIAKTTLTDERPEKHGKERKITPASQGDSPASVAAVPENAGVKTVRATMFEHHVERHTVVANRLGAELKSQPTNDPVANQVGRLKEPWVERALDAKVTSMKASSRQADVTADTETTRKTRLGNAEKTAVREKHPSKERYEKSTPKPVEDSFMYQRIEPRYEVLQMVGERVQSEAIMTAPEDKAVTLRSRKSLKERRRTDRSVTDSACARSLDIPGDGWEEEVFVPKAKELGEGAVKTTSTRELNASSHEQINEVNKYWAAPPDVNTRAPYRDKDWEDKVSKMSAETEKERREVVLAGKMADVSTTPKRFSGSSGVEPSRTDRCEARAVVEMSSSVMGEHRTSQWPAFLNRTSAHLSVDPQRTNAQDKSKVSIAHSEQEKPDVSDRRPKGDRFEDLGVDEKVRKSGRGVSAPKPVERWRRKTLPHDASKFEDAGVLSQERGKSPSRRESFQLWDGSVAKISPKSRYGGEPKESRSGPESGFKSQLSPSESMATYFAVTYEIPDENKNVPGKAPDPFKSKPVPSLTGDASLRPSSGVAKTPHPANGSHSKRAFDTQRSLDSHLGGNRGEMDTAEIRQRGPFKYPLTEAKNRNRAKEGATDLDFPFRGSGTKSPTHLKPLHQDSNQKKSGDENQSLRNDKAVDGYRSRVLDLDALMAEYKEDSKRAPLIQGKNEGIFPEESSVFSWEKTSCSQYSADGTSRGYTPRDPKRAEVSPGSRKQEISASVCEKGVLESYSQERSPLKARDVKFSPPHWGRQAAETAKGSPEDQTPTRKKTFIVDDDQGEGLVLRHQFGSPVRTDVEAGMGFAPLPSRPLAEGASWKAVRGKQETDALKDPDQCADVNLISKRRAGVSDISLESDTFTVPGLASAPPDLRRSYSEKIRQSRVRGSGFPFGPAAREKLEDQRGGRRSFPPENVDNRLSGQAASPHGTFLAEGKKPDVEKDGTRPSREGPIPRNSPYLPIQRRSRSFYRDRRTDHWLTDQLKQCFGKPSADAKDTDTLVQEVDNQYGTWRDQRDSTDSFVPESPSSESTSAPARKPASGGSRLSSFSSQTDPASAADPPDSSRDRRSGSLDRYSMDGESTDGAEIPAPPGAAPDFSFLDQTPVLDSSALKTRVQLSKRRRQRRAPISHSLRRSGVQEEGEQRTPERREVDSAWMFKDSTGEKPSRREDSDEEGRPGPTERSPAPQPQRLPVFPGMDHSALKAQLRKRQEPEGTGGGGGGGIPAQSSRSPKSPFQAGVLPSARMLPVGTEKEERSEEVSPQWLKELKSKRRQSQYENQV